MAPRGRRRSQERRARLLERKSDSFLFFKPRFLLFVLPRWFVACCRDLPRLHATGISPSGFSFTYFFPPFLFALVISVYRKARQVLLRTRVTSTPVLLQPEPLAQAPSFLFSTKILASTEPSGSLSLDADQSYLPPVIDFS